MKMSKKELMVLLEEKKDYIETLEEENQMLAGRLDGQGETIRRLTSDLKETSKQIIDLTNDNRSLKNTLDARDYTIAEQKEELKRQETGLCSFYEKCDTLERDLMEKDRRIRYLEYEIKKQNKVISDLTTIIEKMQPNKDAKQPECTRGDWCKSCVFNECHNVPSIEGLWEKSKDIEICTKNISCENFTPVKEE